MSRLIIEARPRTVVGKKVKNLRKQGLLPANVYGHNLPSRALELNAHDFSRLQRHLSASAIVDLVVDGGRPLPAMIHRTQRDVRSGLPSHIEFFQINPKERLTASVPLVLVGQSDAVKRHEAVLLQEMTQIEVTCLPGDLPESIDVRADLLTHVGAAVHVRDLVFDRDKVSIKANPEDLVATLATPQARAEETTVTPADAEQAASEEGAGES